MINISNIERVMCIKNLSDKNKMVIFLIFLISFFIILSIWYCNKEKTNEKLVISKNIKDISTINEINIGLYNESKIENINPIEINNETIRFVSDLIYNGLFEYNDKLVLGTKLIENYAKIDEKNYVFKLKEDLLFQDGKKLTSKDIKNTIEKIFSNEDSYYSNFIENIQSVKVIDNTTFRINLIEDETNFIENLIFPILSTKINIGTNDYKIKEINTNKIILENEKVGQVINIYIYNNLEMLYRDFKEKKLDLIKSIENIEYQNYIGEFGYQEKSYKGMDYIFFEFNNDTKYFKNGKLKEAILAAINCDEIVKKVFNKNAYDVKKVNYNLDKVIERLETEGYVYKENRWYNKEKILTLNIIFNKSTFNKLEVLYMVKDQLEKIGIKIEFEGFDNKEYHKKVKDKKYDILLIEEKLTPWRVKDLENALICNKLSLLYSLNLSGEINPNSVSIFHNIDTWKKVVDIR